MIFLTKDCACVCGKVVRRVGYGSYDMSVEPDNGCGDNLGWDADDELPDDVYFGWRCNPVYFLFDRHRQSSHRSCVEEPEHYEDNEDEDSIGMVE